MYEWQARSGVRVVSSVPRSEAPYVVALVQTMIYYVRRYGLGKD